jgi:hypothetical protein
VGSRALASGCGRGGHVAIAVPRAPGESGSTPPSSEGRRAAASGRGLRMHGSYLVDSASSHMLVSKIKPCMSKYKQLYRETANGSLNQLSFIR